MSRNGTFASWLVWALACLILCGCGTTTTGTATEQLLISDAVDQAIGQIDFRAISGQKVYLETKYFESLKSPNFVNASYITSSIRQQLTAAQCRIQDKREDADVIVEPRVGALGTDGHEIIYGISQNNGITNAASAFLSTPLPPLPEVSVGKVNAKSGIAKIIVFAYQRETREPVWQSGIAQAESTSRDTWMLGAGPFQKGTIHEGTRFAGERITPPQFQNIVFEPPFKRLKSDESEDQYTGVGTNLADELGEPDVKREYYFLQNAGQPKRDSQLMQAGHEEAEGDPQTPASDDTQ